MPELIRFLAEQGEITGYSNYWVAYPLAFLSDEKIIYTPRLPYHQDLRYTRRDERYAPYAEIVSSAARTAYITTRNPVLDQEIKMNFERLGVNCQEIIIGEYHVYYNLSQSVQPEELGLGKDQP